MISDAKPTSPAPLKREDVEAVYPTRALQEALLLQSSEGSNDVGFVQVRCRVDGRLEPGLIERSWRTVFERHQALRAMIRTAKKQGQSVVVVHRSAYPAVQFFDLADETPPQQAERLSRYLAEDRSRGLPLDRAPVARIAWFQLGADRHELVWTCHHALLDGWSAWLVLDEWRRAYRDLAAQRPVALPEPVSLRTYQDHLARRDEEAEASFWSARLADLPPQRFPPPRTGSSAKPQTFEAFLSHEEAEALNRTARATKVTSGALVSTAWALVLRGFAELRRGASAEVRDDVIFGSVVFGRPATLPGAEAMVGMFINTVPLRCRVDLASPLHTLIRALHAEQQSTLTHQETSLEQLYGFAKHQGPGRLFDTLLVFQNLPQNPGEATEAGPELSEFRSGLNSSYPLALSVEPGEEGWRLALTLDRPRAGIDPELWLEAFRERLIDIEASRETPIGELLPTRLGTAAAAAAPTSVREVVPPSRDIEKILLAIWQRELDVRPALGITDDFFEAGGHSMLAMRIFSEIERQLGCRVPLVALAAHPTVEELARVIEAQLEGASTEVVMIPLASRGSRPPLILMPAMGGEALFWQHLEDWGEERPLYTMGLTTPELPWGDEASLLDMADHFVAAIRRDLDPDVPVHLAGYSFGGNLAFAVGERLREAGGKVGTIVIIDTMLDNPPRPIEPLRSRLRPAAVNLARWLREEIETFDGQRWRSRGERVSQAVLRRLGRGRSSDNPLEGIYEEEAMPEAHLDRVQKDRDAAARYQPAVHPGRLVVLRARRQPILRARPWDLNWGQVVSGPLEVIEVPGNHENLVFPPHGRVLARSMRAALIRGDDE